MCLRHHVIVNSTKSKRAEPRPIHTSSQLTIWRHRVRLHMVRTMTPALGIVAYIAFHFMSEVSQTDGKMRNLCTDRRLRTQLSYGMLSWEMSKLSGLSVFARSLCCRSNRSDNTACHYMIVKYQTTLTLQCWSVLCHDRSVVVLRIWRLNQGGLALHSCSRYQ